MGFHLRRRLLMSAIVVPAVLLTAVQGVTAAAGEEEAAYQQTNLVSDRSGVGAVQPLDADLVNPWGLVAGPTTPWWVSDNGTGKSTLYNGNTGAKVPLTVSVPGAPTGVVFNGGTGFVVHNGDAAGPARFLFASEDGTISGWNPAVPPPLPSKQAFVVVDRSGSGAVYKGLAIASTSAGDFLYASNFHAGTVDVFDSNFAPASLPGSFRDGRIPRGFAPFNVQTIGAVIYVTYAKQNAAKHDDVAGPGNGFVDAFDTSGNLLQRVVSRGRLNSPWGLAIAPAGFGEFSGDLLVGNFGDGRINTYSLGKHPRFRGQLRDVHDRPITIDGLWALRFGNGSAAGSTTTLFFTAGIDGEAHGLFGSIVSVPESD